MSLNNLVLFFEAFPYHVKCGNFDLKYEKIPTEPTEFSKLAGWVFDDIVSIKKNNGLKTLYFAPEMHSKSNFFPHYETPPLGWVGLDP